MDTIDSNIQQNINSLIIGKLSNGVDRLSIEKIKNYIKSTYNIDVDDDMIANILNKNPKVSHIDGDEIVLGTKENDQEEEVNNETLDTAKEQADNNLSALGGFFESVADALTNIKHGMEYDSKKLQLDESNLYYHLHKGALKTKSVYVVNEIKPSSVLDESVVECFIKGSNLLIELPIKIFVK